VPQQPNCTQKYSQRFFPNNEKAHDVEFYHVVFEHPGFKWGFYVGGVTVAILALVAYKIADFIYQIFYSNLYWIP